MPALKNHNQKNMLMKKSILLLSLVVFALQGQIFASSVSPQQAQNIAANFFKIKVPTAAGNPALSLSLVYTQTESDGTNDFYIFNASPMKGFVIVSGDNNAMPVIAYSTESNFVVGDYSKIGLSDWMKSTAVRIHYVVTNAIQADANITNLWTSYAAGINPQTSRAGGVGPLCQSTWNQNPYYNGLCPPAALPSTSNSKAVTGCVATAMAQIMRYWNYPAQGTGSNTYNDNGPPNYSVNYGTLTADFTRPLIWSAMPLNNSSITTDHSPVDSLMFELGVAVDMDYDSTGSGAFVLTSESGGGPCAQTVYANNFFYNPNTLQGVQLASYTDADWITLMENEINSGRIAQYEGDDPTEGGHTWLMDGYEPNAGGDLLHMNWGWGGVYDGYFAVTNLSTPGFDPSERDAALIGIEPLLPFSVSITPASLNICPSNSTNITVQGPANATYSWTPTTGLACTTCSSTTAYPSATTQYTVTIDSAGVSANVFVTVVVTPPVTAGFNFTTGTSCNLPQAVSFTNSSSNATSYVWNFGDGTTSTDANPVHPYTADGSYTVELYATNACGVDSFTSSQPVQISGGAPTAPSATICSGQSATLNATGSNLNWYSDAGGVNLMAQGSSYTSPPLTNNITYYVGSIISPAVVTAGPTSDGFGANQEYTRATTGTALRGMIFNNTVAQTLNSVVVYATGSGGRTFILEDSAGNVLDSATMPLLSGQQTVPLGFSVPAGNNMLLAILGTTNLGENTAGAVYPYVSGDGTVTITGNNATGATTRYYFFYDWQLQQPACNTPLTPVTVYVLNGGGAGGFWVTGNGTSTVNFTPNDLTAGTYTWYFGDGTSATQLSPTHTYSSAGTYSVELIVSNGTCSDTVTQTVNTVTAAGIKTINGISSLSVYPNPANGLLTLSVNSSNPVSGCQLSVSNVLGQTTYSQSVDLESGTNKFSINISNLSEGVYFINLQNGGKVFTTKFVKE